jgi:glutamate racemase
MLGIFDSGFGGLTVLRAIHERLPKYSTMYLGDNARAPYGVRSHDEIFGFTLDGVRELFRRGCPLVVLACNTASAQALRQIQQTVLPSEFPDRRVLGVIRPTAEEIAWTSPSGHLGVFATPATVASEAYVHELADIERAGTALRVTQAACPGLVDLIERGEDASPEACAIAASAAAKLMASDPLIDSVLLGCTHYPLVEPLFRAALPPNVRVVRQGSVVAAKLADYLARHPEISARIDQSGTRTYLTTKADTSLSDLASRFYGSPIEFSTVTSSGGDI